jgi:Fe-S-cluster containining protein
MSETQDNPCKECTLNHDCCRRFSGLMLTRDEYERHFRNTTEGLVVKKANGFFVVSSRTEGECPYWGNGGCLIYPDRPIDCRLYPYVIRHLIEKKRKVHMVFHDRSACPQRDSVYALMPESEIRALVKAFGRKVYGESKTIIVHREKGVLSRLRYRIEAALSRHWNKIGCR